MTKVQDDALSACPVARAVDIVGDKWTILILRELYMGNTRFEEIQIQTEANPQLLAGRLKALEANEMIERKPYSERPLRYEYVLRRFIPRCMRFAPGARRGARRRVKG